ncbi:extracellular solute-binding protein [Dethiothermospora halolimnae]|uniref:extracellular solute-binding protein n=1 Tax=Dethiothermospora halolimnae TaxID=3114390 RepID=UPI003CCB7F89
MKRIIISIIFIILIYSLFGCHDGGGKIANGKDKKKELIIITWGEAHPVCDMYKQVFEEEYNVKVNYEKIETSSYEEYLKKLHTKLYLENGPTLLFIENRDMYQKYIDRGIAVDVTSKIPNIAKLYNGFNKEKVYYVPVGMDYWPIELNRKYLKKIGVKEPKLNWTREDYLNLKRKWSECEPRPFSYREYLDIVKYPLENLNIIYGDNTTINITNDKIKNYIKHAKGQIYSGRYILNPDYKYEMYTEYGQDYSNKETTKLMNFNNDICHEVLNLTGIENGLHITDMLGKEEKNVLLLPDVMRNSYQINTWGFLVNRNGKNTELGYKFINGLLEDEQQINIYRDMSYADFPVIKGIEEQIGKIEKEREIEDRFIKLKEYILDKFNKGEYKVYNSQGSKKVEFYNMLEEDLVEIIFDEKEYSDEELSRKLQKLEDKYNMWLTE